MRRVVVLVMLCVVAFTSCKENSENKEVLTKEVTFKKEGNLILKKAATDSVIVQLEIEIAEGEYETQTGLMYRSSMQNNRGMLFVFEDVIMRSFYMKNTQFPLDIIYLGEDQKIINIQKNAVPFNQTSLPSEAPAKYVLEINAGLSDQWGLSSGDQMEFSRTID